MLPSDLSYHWKVAVKKERCSKTETKKTRMSRPAVFGVPPTPGYHCFGQTMRLCRVLMILYPDRVKPNFRKRHSNNRLCIVDQPPSTLCSSLLSYILPSTSFQFLRDEGVRHWVPGQRRDTESTIAHHHHPAGCTLAVVVAGSPADCRGNWDIDR
jgi:hypothetical protein